MLQFQRMRVVSDLITLNECSHFPGLAIVRVSGGVLVVVGMSMRRSKHTVCDWGKEIENSL